MTRPENDAELSARVAEVQKLAGKLNAVTRERGLPGLADELSTLYAAVREADWRAQKLLGPWWKRVF